MISLLILLGISLLEIRLINVKLLVNFDLPFHFICWKSVVLAFAIKSLSNWDVIFTLFPLFNRFSTLFKSWRLLLICEILHDNCIFASIVVCITLPTLQQLLILTDSPHHYSITFCVSWLLIIIHFIFLPFIEFCKNSNFFAAGD